VAVLANVGRVAFTGVGAQLFGPVVTGPLHYYIGKGFWLLALLSMIWLAAALRARTATRIEPLKQFAVRSGVR
jgi:exosortase/archaeosortase family protein